MSGMQDVPASTLAKLCSVIMEDGFGMESLGPILHGNYTDKPTFELSLTRLRVRYPDLYDDFVAQPLVMEEFVAKTVQHLEDAVEYCDQEPDLNEPYIKELPHWPDSNTEVRVRIIDVPNDLKLDIGKTRGHKTGELVAFEGVCQQTSDPKPRLLEAEFFCGACGHVRPVDLRTTFDLSDVTPQRCPECGDQNTWQRNHDKDVRKEFQQIRVQEPPEEAVNASSPRDVTCDAEGRQHIDQTQPGDRVTVVGKLREDGDNTSTLRDDRLKVLGVIREETQFEDVEFDEEDVEKIKTLAEDPELFDTLANSMAPSIYGHEKPKLGIALQLFGGVSKYSYNNRKRGQIHQLLMGEPGTGKSQLLEYARGLAPRAIQSGGSGATEVGLTATATKEKIGDEEQWTLSAGSLVLADGGLITIDELDNFQYTQQQALDMALSDGEITVDKANVHATLNARCSALMAANPVDGRFDRYEPYPEQFDIPKELLNRCDLIWAFEDSPDAAVDGDIGEAILNPHLQQPASADGGQELPVDENGVISPELFQKWVAYSRREVRPTLSEEAARRLNDWYTTIRTELSDEDHIAIGPRRLDGARRLSQAAARAQLMHEATKEHAELAIDLMMSWMKQVARDPDTGQFDVDRIAVGSGSKAQQDRVEKMKKTLREMQDEYDPGVPIMEYIDALEAQGVAEEKARHRIQKWKDNGTLYEPKDGHLRLP